MTSNSVAESWKSVERVSKSSTSTFGGNINKSRGKKLIRIDASLYVKRSKEKCGIKVAVNSNVLGAG